MTSYTPCPDSALGTHNTNVKGVCYWCGKKVESAVPKPERFGISEQTDWYSYYYDPDYEGPYE